MDGWIDGQTDRQTDENDFIGRCLTSVQRPIRSIFLQVFRGEYLLQGFLELLYQFTIFKNLAKQPVKAYPMARKKLENETHNNLHISHVIVIYVQSRKKLTLQDQCSHHIETSQLICRANQLTGFYMMGTLVVKVLMGQRKEIKPKRM